MQMKCSEKSLCGHALSIYPEKLFAAVLMFGIVTMWGTAFSDVVEDGGNTYIIDRAGERWEVTQARSLGFRTALFQYGIGRYTIAPLDNSHLIDDPDNVPEHLRVIGVHEDAEAQAYSVSKLTRHEIANTDIGEMSIAVGY